MFGHKSSHRVKALFAAVAVSTIGIASSAARAADPDQAQSLPMQDAPLSIAACQVTPVYASVPAGDSGINNIATGANLRIAFQNRSSQPITDVTFVLNTPDGKVAITDRGWFSSRVPIQRNLGPYANLSAEATCELHSVRFNDGTHWERE
jgi:hypothetical protein